MLRTDIALGVRELLAARSPRPLDPAAIEDDLALGEDGAGLDSIAIAELLLDCEQRFGEDAGGLVEQVDGPLTVGRLVDLLAA